MSLERLFRLRCNAFDSDGIHALPGCWVSSEWASDSPTARKMARGAGWKRVRWSYCNPQATFGSSIEDVCPNCYKVTEARRVADLATGR